MNIVDRITSLMNRAADAASSETESTTALRHAERLMREHGVTEDQLREGAKSTGIVTMEWTSPTIQLNEIANVLTAIAAFTETRSITATGNGTVVRFVGYRTDAQLAVYLTDLIYNALKAEYSEFRKKGDYGQVSQAQSNLIRRSFLVAMAGRIRTRIIDMVAARAVQGSTGTSTALVVVKRANVAEAFEARYPSRRTPRHRRTITVLTKAYDEGQAAGDRTTITTGIEEYA